MANIYYTDTLGSKLNVFEKKTKGGEPFYYIYLNKNLITRADIDTLISVIKGSISKKLTIKVKEGKLAYTISWSYDYANVSLSDQQVLFDAMFKWLKDFGYVDTYQAKATRSNKTTTTSTPSTTIDSVSIPTKTLEVGDEFYFGNDLLNKTRSFVPLYKLDSFDKSDKLNVSWIDKDGKPHNLDGWISRDEAQKFVMEGKITFPNVSKSTEFKKYDVFVENKTETIYYIDDIFNDRSYIMRNFSKTLQKGIGERVLENELKLYIKNGNFTQIKLEKGVEFVSRNGLLIWKVIDVSNSSIKYNAIEPTYKTVVDEDTRLLGNFLNDLVNMDFTYKPSSSATQTTTPVQVGDEFIIVDDPNNITKIERQLIYTIVSIDLLEQDADYKNRYGNIFTLPFDDFRTRIDSGNFIILNRATKTTTSQQGVITSLSYYDLMRRVVDGLLFRVLHVDSVVDKDDTFYKIPDDSIVDLEYYDENNKKIELQQILFGDLKYNIKRGELEYLGQVRNGDSFVNGANLERFVIKVNDYPHDVNFALNDLNFNPPKELKYESEVMNVFTKNLLNQQYKLNLRLGSTSTTTPTTSIQPQVTPKPQISSDEIDALKKEISDLLFLKNGISDLDFEEKINISTEIAETQRKIDDLTEKLFEQRVGDENFFDKLFEQSFTPLKDRYDLDIVPNIIPEIISPSGEMSDLDENMQQLVNSSEFKDWFGDWRNAYFYRNLDDFGGLNISKVMNDKFEPQLVWHGTNNEFSYFDFEMFPANYFAVNKEYSEFFATNKGGRGFVLPFFLNIKNPLDLSDFGIANVSSKDFFDWMFLMTGMTPEELEVNPLFLDPNVPPNPIWVYIRNNPTMLKKIAMGNVYDGIKFYEFNPNEQNNPDKRAYETLAYIIFDPHQAKLADPSRGEILLSSLKSFMLKQGGKI